MIEPPAPPDDLRIVYAALVDAHGALEASHAKLAADFAASERERLTWEQRADHLESLLKETEDRVAILEGRAATASDLNGPYDPAKEGTRISVGYGDWYRQMRLKVNAENDRDKNKAVAVEVLKLLAPGEPVYHLPVAVERAKEILQDRNELAGQLDDANRRAADARRALAGKDAEALALRQVVAAHERAAAEAEARRPLNRVRRWLGLGPKSPAPVPADTGREVACRE